MKGEGLMSGCRLIKKKGRGVDFAESFRGVSKIIQPFSSSSIEIKILGRFRAIDTYFWIQTLRGRGGQQKVWTKSILSFLFFLDELPYFLFLVQLPNREGKQFFAISENQIILKFHGFVKKKDIH